MAILPEILLSKAARTRCITYLQNISPKSPFYIVPVSPVSNQASVLVPICVINEEVCLLYTLRSSLLSRNRGQVSFPGGKRDLMESVLDTALRETEEEIGFPRELVDVWTEMQSLYFPQGPDNPRMLITPIIGLLKNFDINNMKINSDEVDEVFTVSLSTFCNRNNHAHFVINNLPIPVYLCGKHKIWGITGIITHLFLSAFLPSELYNPNFMNKSYKLEELMLSKL